VVDGTARPDAAVRIPLAMVNRHGLVAGATGTGKTKTLQLMAEQLSAAGVPVMAADIKGDLSGLAEPGEATERTTARATEVGQAWSALGCPVELLALHAERYVDAISLIEAAAERKTVHGRVLGETDARGRDDRVGHVAVEALARLGQIIQKLTRIDVTVEINEGFISTRHDVSHQAPVGVEASDEGAVGTTGLGIGQDPESEKNEQQTGNDRHQR